MLEHAIDRATVLGALGRELLHVLAHRGEPRRDRGTALGVFLALRFADGLLLGAARVVLGLACVALFAAGRASASRAGSGAARPGAAASLGLRGVAGGDAIARALGSGALAFALSLALDRAELVGAAGLLLVDAPCACRSARRTW